MHLRFQGQKVHGSDREARRTFSRKPKRCTTVLGWGPRPRGARASRSEKQLSLCVAAGHGARILCSDSPELARNCAAGASCSCGTAPGHAPPCPVSLVGNSSRRQTRAPLAGNLKGARPGCWNPCTFGRGRKRCTAAGGRSLHLWPKPQKVHGRRRKIRAPLAGNPKGARPAGHHDAGCGCRHNPCRRVTRLACFLVRDDVPCSRTCSYPRNAESRLWCSGQRS